MRPSRSSASSLLSIADPVAHYPFDETTGTVANDRSGNGRHAAIVNGNAATVWNGGRGLTLPGGNGGTAPAVRLPDGLLSGLDDVTIAYDIRLSSATQQGPVFAFGRTADNGGYLTATPGAGTTPHQASIAGPGAGAPAQTAAAPVSLAANAWTHVAVTVKGGGTDAPGQLLLYEDGELMTSNTTLTVKPRDITSAVGFIGRSSTAAGQQFRGRIKDFRVYSGVLTAGEVQALSDAAAAGNLAELVASVDLGDTSATTKNLALPSLPGVTWSTSDPAVITAQGEVTRPAAGRGDAQRDADGHVHAPRVDGVQGVPRHGQATRRHLARPAGGGPGALLQARRDRRHRADGLGHRRRRGHRHAGQPRQGRPGRATASRSTPTATPTR